MDSRVKLEQAQEEIDNNYSVPQTSNSTQRKKSEKEKIIETSFFENENYILEQIDPATDATLATILQKVRTPKFIKYSKLDKKIEEIEEVREGGYSIRPITNKIVDKKTILLPSGVEEYETTDKLIKEIKDYFYSYFEVPNLFNYFLPYYVLFTWIYDKFPFVPYLHFVGLTSTGKSTAAEVVGSVCYKAIDAGGSVTIAAIFRAADQWRGTLMLDEFDLANFGEEGYGALSSFLKTGVADKTILRVEGDTKRELTPYSVKSPKIFTSEMPISGAGLQSRVILIKMEENKRKIPLFRLPKYQVKGQSLRNKLLLWRLHNLNKIDLSEIEFGFEELQPFNRRVQQVLTPIYYLSNDDGKKEILKFAKVQQEETVRERRESLEGMVFEVISDLWNLIQIQPTLGEIFTKVAEKRSKMGYKSILTERKLANIIRKVLNFDIDRVGHENISTVLIEKDLDRMATLTKYYGCNKEGSPPPE